MVAAHRQRHHVRGAQPAEERLDVGHALLERKRLAHRHVADVGDLERPIGAIFSTCSYGPMRSTPRTARGPSARAGAVGDAEIHRHADQRDVDVAELAGSRSRPGAIIGAPRKVATPANGHLR